MTILHVRCDRLCYVCFCIELLFFFFKQKTAYEMRISDWSSDVCSSDLGPDQDRAGSANRMTQRDRSSSDIHLCMIDVELTHEFQRHHRERLIDFEQIDEIGRASCRERVCQYVYVSVVAVSLKKTKAKT